VTLAYFAVDHFFSGLALMRDRAGSFSVERLMEFLTALGQDVEISVKPARGRQGEVSLV